MKKRKNQSNKSFRERGQSLVELAISLPILILLLLGTVDFGMAIFSFAIIRDAAQEGALYGSFNPDNKTEIENRARNISPQGEDEIFSSPVELTDRELVQVEVKAIGDSCQGTTDGEANSVRVRVRYNYSIFMPFIGTIIGTDTIPPNRIRYERHPATPMPMKKIIRNSSSHNNSEKGQAMILIVFSIIGLIGMAALAIDGGNAYVDSRRAETAASAAALTAATTRIEGGNWRAAALLTAADNGYNNDGITNTVELNTPPMSGDYSNNPEYIEVIVTSHLRTYFGSVIGIPEITSVSRVISQSKPAVLGELFGGYALVSLAPHSRCDSRKSFWIHSEATINLEGGGLFVNSDNAECAFMSFGSGSVRVRDTSPISVVGGAQVQKPKLITPFPMQTGVTPIPYPPSIKYPKIDCGDKNAKVDEETGSIMSPGNWDEDVFPPDGVTTLKSGTYCLTGDFIVDAGQHLEGTNVLFFIDGGRVGISGNATVRFSAPNGGNFQGLLFFVPIGNHNIIALNGSDDSNYRGTIFAPGADVRINGLDAGGGAAYHSQIIGYYVEVDGTDNIYIKYKDEQNYDALKMPEVLLIQ